MISVSLSSKYPIKTTTAISSPGYRGLGPYRAHMNKQDWNSQRIAWNLRFILMAFNKRDGKNHYSHIKAADGNDMGGAGAGKILPTWAEGPAGPPGLSPIKPRCLPVGDISQIYPSAAVLILKS